MESLGIDIGSFSIKVAKVRAVGKSYELLAYSEYPLSPDPSKDNQLEIIEALRDIERRYWTEGTQVVFGAPQGEVSFRRKMFEFRERHKISKTLPFQLEDEIPLTAENSVFDARISHYVGSNAHLMAFACPKESLVRIIKRAMDSGMTPDIVSVDGVAACTLFEEWRESPLEYPGDSQPLPENYPVDLVLHIGHKSALLGVIKDGYLLDLRQIDWGGKDIAETVANRYGMHYLEALKDLKRRAFILTTSEGATREQITMSDVIKSSVDTFAVRLRLALVELQNLYQISYRQVFLTGGLAQLRNLGPYLTQKIEIATNRLGRLEQVPSVDFANSPNGELAVTVAIGLAVEGLKRPKNPALNLLKGEFAPKSQTAQILWDRWGHTVRLAAALFVAGTVWAFTREMIASDNDQTAYDVLSSQARNIVGTVGSGPVDRKVRAYIQDQEQRLKAKEMVERLQGVPSALDVLKTVSTLAPQKDLGLLNIFEFNVSGSDLVVAGEGSQPAVIAELEKALRSYARDEKVQTQPAPKAKTAGYKSFRFNVKIDRRGG